MTRISTRVLLVAAVALMALPVGAQPATPASVLLAFSTLRPEGAGQLLWSLDALSLLKALRSPGR